MGTKLNPGKWDCYAKAAPDEPMFILLARDPLAPVLVRLWSDLRASDGLKALEAMEVAAAMDEWKDGHRPIKA